MIGSQEVFTARREFRPELLSRRGEVVAWALTLLVGAAWFILILAGNPVSMAVPILAVLLLLSAASISLGNFVDRKTVLSMDETGIRFVNGLRRANINWSDIRKVAMTPSGWGKKVGVLGPKSFFSFRTLGEVSIQGEVKGRLGFREGDYILKEILERSELKRSWQEGMVVYYARE